MQEKQWSRKHACAQDRYAAEYHLQPPVSLSCIGFGLLTAFLAAGSAYCVPFYRQEVYQSYFVSFDSLTISNHDDNYGTEPVTHDVPFQAQRTPFSGWIPQSEQPTAKGVMHSLRPRYLHITSFPVVYEGIDLRFLLQEFGKNWSSSGSQQYGPDLTSFAYNICIHFFSCNMHSLSRLGSLPLSWSNQQRITRLLILYQITPLRILPIYLRKILPFPLGLFPFWLLSDPSSSTSRASWYIERIEECNINNFHGRLIS